MPGMSDLITLTDNGIYCPLGDFYIDPWRPVDRAVITHAHSDHATRGSRDYLTTPEGLHVLRARMGHDALIRTIPYREPIDRSGLRLTLYPAGHVLGSAQVRLEARGQVAVVSGDYKREPDPTCAPFEPVRCHLFLTESTFGLPIYRWPQPATTRDDLNTWWRDNASAGRASIVFAYALGKAQRILASLDPTIGPIIAHGAVETMVRAYRASGITLPQTRNVAHTDDRHSLARALVLAPPSAQGTPWMRRFPGASTAFASGWMRIRGTRRRRAFDRGFVISDHVDWPALIATIQETGAERVWVTHGYSAVVTRWLTERGIDARAIGTRFVGESVTESPDVLADSNNDAAPPFDNESSQ